MVRNAARHISAKYRVGRFAPIFLDHEIGGKMRMFRSIFARGRARRRGPRLSHSAFTHDPHAENIFPRTRTRSGDRNSAKHTCLSRRLYFPRNYSRGDSTLRNSSFFLCLAFLLLFFFFVVVSISVYTYTYARVCTELW